MKILVIGFLMLMLGACQTSIKPDFERLSGAMQVTRVTTPYHQHFVLLQPSSKSSDTLHVYIEGDGRPWVKRYLVAKDPTPRAPLTLNLMRQDGQPAIFLGRPCYFNDPAYGLTDAHCNARLWTSARYSDVVVASMVDALRQLLADQDYQHVTLIGYSGGGTIAALMAQRMPEVTRLVTIAANLDVAAWTRHHVYSPLTESLDPARTGFKQPANQLHLAGSKDQTVPPELSATLLQAQGQSLTVIDGYDHRCCWAEKWRELMGLNNL